MATLGIYPRFKATDLDGHPLAGGQLFTFISGTSTPTAVYHDALFEDAHANPVILDDSGEALLYFAGVQKWVLKTQHGEEIWTTDPVGLTPTPPDAAWATVGGGYVVGCGGVPQVVAPTQVRLGDYQAFMPNGAFVDQPQVTVPLSGPDGLYWIALHEETVGDVENWTRFPGTNLLWAGPLAVPPTAPNPQLLGVAGVTMSAGACSAVTDQAVHRVTQPTTVASPMTTMGIWYVTPPGRIEVASGATWTCHGPLLAPGVPGILPGPGMVKFGPQQASNPVWFCASGSGLKADPWVSGDGSGGFIAACAAVQANGTLHASPGAYRFTSALPAQFDLPVTSSLGMLVVELAGVLILVDTPGTVLKLNKNGVIGDTSTNLNTVHIHGGQWTTVAEGASESECPIRGTALDLTRCRNVSIRQAKFIGMQTAIVGSVADTLSIQENFFRRCYTSLHFPAIGQPDLCQDLTIENNTASLTDFAGDMDGCVWLRADAATGHLVIRANGIACNATNARFVRCTTGDGGNAARELLIEANATEQFSTGSKLVEIVRSGTLDYRNVTLRGNQFSSALAASGPPFANGQPLVDLAYCSGVVLLENNECTNTAVTAFKVDNLRSDTDGVGGLCVIRANRLSQLSAFGGKLFDVTTMVGTGTRLQIGRNATVPFYAGTIGAMVYPADRTAFDTTSTYTSAVAAATSITLAPWDNAVTVNGTTPVTTITPTWKGHVVEITLSTALGTLVTDTGNLRLQGNLVARSTVLPSKITLGCDGTLWTELSRFNQQLAETVASATTITINSFSTYVGLSGTATIQTITGGKNGQTTTFRLQEASTLKDAVGNLQLAGDIVGNASGGVLVQLVFDSTTWRQTSPVVTVQP